MTIEVGKLYSCSEYFLLLFPDKETAARTTAAGIYRTGVPAADASYWTRELGKPVSYCNPLTPLLVLSVNEKYVEVLAGDRKVWIINDDWLEIKEIVDAAD
jgi:hypothetical protein